MDRLLPQRRGNFGIAGDASNQKRPAWFFLRKYLAIGIADSGTNLGMPDKPNFACCRTEVPRPLNQVWSRRYVPT